MNKIKKNKLLILSAALMISTQAASADENACHVDKIRVLAQKSLGLTNLKNHIPEFEKKYKTDVEMVYFGESDRRAKSRLDAATGAGAFNVYYVDEANVAEFASAQWIYPLMDYYPKKYDYNDFLPGRRSVASYNGVPYFAPIIGGGDFLYYRKDLFEKAGLVAPETMDDLIHAVKTLPDYSCSSAIAILYV